MVKTGENSWFFTNPLTKGQFKKQFALLVYRDDRPNHWYFFQRLKDGNWQIQEIVQDAIKSGSLYTADNAYKEYMKLRKNPWDCLYNADATMEWNKRSKSLWRGVRGRPKGISKTKPSVKYYTDPWDEDQYKRKKSIFAVNDEGRWAYHKKMGQFTPKWEVTHSSTVHPEKIETSLVLFESAFGDYVSLYKKKYRFLVGKQAEEAFKNATAGTKKPTGYTKKVAGEFMKAVPIHGIRPMKKPATAKNTSASKKNTTSTSSKKPTARKTIKGKEGYSLIEKKKKGYCVPETKQTYWKRL